MATRAYAVSDQEFLPSGARVPGILRHLVQLSGSFATDTDRITYVHVYARPDVEAAHGVFHSIRAAESGREGIACVDDVARAAILVRGRVIGPADLQPVSVQPSAEASPNQTGSLLLRDILAETESRVIRQALEQEKWNRTRAAQVLGISRRQLFDKIRQYGLQE